MQYQDTDRAQRPMQSVWHRDLNTLGVLVDQSRASCCFRELQTASHHLANGVNYLDCRTKRHSLYRVRIRHLVQRWSPDGL